MGSKLTWLLFLLLGFGFFSPAYAGVNLKDGRGKPVVLKEFPQRIVSVSLASDEILLAILPQNSPRLIALSKFATDPTYSVLAQKAQLLKVKIVGTELESLLVLHPDLVILASYNRPDFVRKLDAAHIKTYVLSKFENISDIKANIRTIGKLVGREPAADKLVTQSFALLDSLAAQKKKMTVISYSDGLVIPGEKTMFDSICDYAHVINKASAAGLSGWAKTDPESLLKLNPDYIVVPLQADETEQAAALKVRAHYAFGKLPAAIQGRFIFVPSALLTSVSHTIVQAVVMVHAGAYGQ